MRTIIHRLVALMLTIGIAGAPLLAQPQETAPGESELWRAMLEKLEAGALVSVRLKDGTRTKGTVLEVQDETFTFKPLTRIPVPARNVRFEDVSTIERQKRSMSPAKKVLLGVGIGTAVYVLTAALVVAAIGYD
jgi:hypothetical protein